ncbi:response regulator [Exilibacterium tricleocarpae]|uniref:histidine kinase n=1 Tax=Exilibacterium tricleocarpae TaxID=2591008 RepID=A0A545U3Y3_9GAMM|nr:ATP-binding protein [Exilibacterium tricleocarpae]TQV84170.1 response regulator [Exilibacterium tricleocarpae]
MSSIARNDAKKPVDAATGELRYSVYLPGVLLALLGVVVCSYLLSRYHTSREVDGGAAVVMAQMQALPDSGGSFEGAESLRAITAAESVVGLVLCAGGRAYAYLDDLVIEADSFCARRLAVEFNGSLISLRGLIENRFWANYYVADAISSGSNFWILYKVPPNLVLMNAGAGLLIFFAVWGFALKAMALRDRRYTEHLERELEMRVNDRSRRLLDINYQLRMEVEKAVALRKDAESKNQAKQDYLSNMSHEIRTPLNGMLGTVEVLMKSTFDKKQQRLLNRINRAGGALHELISGILDMGKIEAGRLELEQKTFCLTELVSDSIELYLETAEKKGIGLSLDIADHFPSYLVGDPQRLYQVLNNLLSNAIKFSEHGAVQVKLSGALIAAGQFDFRLAVKDTGIGIDRERQADLFDRFTQADASVSREYGGSGLGLAICKTLVDLMGGTISLTSEQGRGSEFTVALALPVASSAAVAVSIRPGAQREGINGINVIETDSDDGATAIDGPVSGAHVLVVEDTEVNRQMVFEMLDIMGVPYQGVANGEEALAAYEKHAYTCILMDCHMPRMNGYEATRRIRALEGAKGGHTPIVALTANAIAGEREKCLAAGMDDFLAKPFTFDKLQYIVSRWASAAELTEESPGAGGDGNTAEHENTVRTKPASEAPAAGGDAVSVDDHIDVLVIESIFDLQQKAGSDLLHRMISNYFSSAPGLLQELRARAHGGQWDELRLLAHKLKSASVNVGLIQVGEKAHDLEHAENLEAIGVAPLLEEVEREIHLCDRLMRERVIPTLR